jgi:RNA polymerase sigma-70 factor, ECF subfamily
VGEPFSLSRSFVAASERPQERGPAPDWLEPELRRIDSAARSAWPHLSLDPGTFVAHLARVTDRQDDLRDALSTVRAADVFLACACSCGVAAGLADFDRVHLSQIPAYVRRIDPSRGFADDVAQSIRETFLVRRNGRPSGIAEYSGRGALGSWVRVIAVRTALRFRRERGRAGASPERSCDSPEPVGTVDPELDYLRLRYRGAFDDALRAALASLPDRDALLLQLHYVDGLNIDRIGALYGMHRSTVARWRTAVRRGVLAATREHLRGSMSLTDSDFDSLAALVRSQLTVSLRTALGRAN